MSSTVEQPDKLLTRREAAEYLGVAAQTLGVWAMKGTYKLPYIKVGGLAKYRRSDLDVWLANRTGTSVAQFAAAK